MEKIVMLAETRGTADFVRQQLEVLFQPYAQLEVVIADPSLPPLSLDGTLVVIISKVLEDQMQRYIRPGVPVLIADRMMDPKEISQLYDIPGGSNVLVVNTSPKVTEETISQLKASGIKGLRYHPYYPGIGTYRQDCRYAVSFGEEHLIPEGNYLREVKLASRPIGMATCVRIAQELGIYDEMRDTLSSLYLNPLVRMTHDLVVTDRKRQQLSDLLQRTIDLFQDGVLVLDHEKNVVFTNLLAKKILQIQENWSPVLEEVLSMYSDSSQFFHEINGVNYYFELVSGRINQKNNVIITISSVEKIEQIGDSYRRTLVEKGLVARYTFSDIIYKSAVMAETVEIAREFARGDSTVFLHGESGCGKELLAQAIHNASRRKKEAFVAVNFASIAAELAESELFGYEEGAFTGARRGGKPGLFMMAHNGTIFLDEIGDAPLELQKKLLRVIQERRVLPVGGTRMIPIDVRIIAASNQDMGLLLKERRFREDLYYRLNVLPLNIPPLRQRRDDIPLLFLHFLQKTFGISEVCLGQELRRMLHSHPWRGNVRELRNMAEYASNFIGWDSRWEERLLSTQQAPCGTAADETGTVSMDGAAVKYDEHTATLTARLEGHGDLRYYQRILELLDRPPYYWSRAAVAAGLYEQYGEKVGESRVKRDFLLLKESGLVNSVTGKGTYLKEQGRALLELLREASIK